MQKTVAAHHQCLRPQPVIEPEIAEASPADQRHLDRVVAGQAAHAHRVENSRLVQRTRARYEAVQA